MKIKNVIHLILLFGLLILAGAAAGQAAAPITAGEVAGYGVNLADISDDDYYQLQYGLKIIEITEKGQQRFDIDQLLLSSNSQGNFKFYRQGELLEVVDLEGINKIAATYESEKSLNYRVAEPEIIVSSYENALLAVGEERLLLQDKGDLTAEITELSISLFPRQVSRDKEQVVTEVVIRAEGQAYFVTSLRMNTGKEILAGLLSLNADRGQSQTTGKNTNEGNRVFAVFLVVNKVEVLARDKGNSPLEILNLSGLDSLFLNRGDLDTDIGNTHLLLRTGQDLSLSGYFDLEWIGLAFELDQKDSLIRLEVDRYILARMQLAAVLYRSKNSQVQLGLGVREEIKTESGLTLAAGFYPLIYDHEQQEYEKGYWWFELETVPYRGWFFSLQRQQEMTENILRLGVGKEMGDRCDLILFYSAVPGDKGRFELGYRLNF